MEIIVSFLQFLLFQSSFFLFFFSADDGDSTQITEATLCHRVDVSKRELSLSMHAFACDFDACAVRRKCITLSTMRERTMRQLQHQILDTFSFDFSLAENIFSFFASSSSCRCDRAHCCPRRLTLFAVSIPLKMSKVIINLFVINESKLINHFVFMFFCCSSNSFFFSLFPFRSLLPFTRSVSVARLGLDRLCRVQIHISWRSKRRRRE